MVVVVSCDDAKDKLQIMAGQEMGMKSMVEAMTNRSDIYITVKESVQCTLNSNVGIRPSSPLV